MNIIFAKTRWFYQSYIDFWRLVELSAFPTCFVDEMDVYNPDNVYIVAPMNGEWRPFIDERPNRRARLILWNLERPGGSGSIEKYTYDNHILLGKYLDMIVVSDRDLAKQCRVDYLPLGGHPDFGIPGSFDSKKYDVIHLSCYSNNRSWLFNTPDNPKAVIRNTISVARNSWGQDRHWSLQESRFMLNIHQDGFPFMEPLRFALAAAYGLRIISEFCNDAFPYTTHILPLEEIHHFVDGYDRLAYDRGLRLRGTILQDFPFRKCVENYVENL